MFSAVGSAGSGGGSSSLTHERLRETLAANADTAIAVLEQLLLGTRPTPPESGSEVLLTAGQIVLIGVAVGVLATTTLTCICLCYYCRIRRR